MENRVRALEMRVEELEEEVRQLHELLGPTGVTLPEGLKLTPTEQRVLEVLLAQKRATTDQLCIAISGPGMRKYVTPDTLKVHMFRVRKKLREFCGAEIETLWAVGYTMTPENKDKVFNAREEDREDLRFTDEGRRWAAGKIREPLEQGCA